MAIGRNFIFEVYFHSLNSLNVIQYSRLNYDICLQLRLWAWRVRLNIAALIYFGKAVQMARIFT